MTHPFQAEAMDAAPSQTVPLLLQALAATPHLLEDMIRQVPSTRLKAHRIQGQWCIHAQAVHIIQVQPMLLGRLNRFLSEGHPVFTPYIPDRDSEDPEAALLRQDLHGVLRAFHGHRQDLIAFAAQAPAGFWDRKAKHPEYDEYTPTILLRHMLMHEHLHMYRIETLWLTSDAYLPTEGRG
jgi:DinB superfamily